jgi:hypothetical protein
MRLGEFFVRDLRIRAETSDWALRLLRRLTISEEQRFSEVVDHIQAGSHNITHNFKPRTMIVLSQAVGTRGGALGRFGELLLTSSLRGADIDDESAIRTVVTQIAAPLTRAARGSSISPKPVDFVQPALCKTTIGTELHCGAYSGRKYRP